MMKGIGIDTVSREKTERILNTAGEDYVRSVYTEYEIGQAGKSPDPVEYYATRFAVKEAVFKAIAPLLQGEELDLRKIETRNREDGSPYVYIDEKMRKILHSAGLQTVLISITTEDDHVTAIAAAE